MTSDPIAASMPVVLDRYAALNQAAHDDSTAVMRYPSSGATQRTSRFAAVVKPKPLNRVPPLALHQLQGGARPSSPSSSSSPPPADENVVEVPQPGALSSSSRSTGGGGGGLRVLPLTTDDRAHDVDYAKDAKDCE